MKGKKSLLAVIVFLTLAVAEPFCGAGPVETIGANSRKSFNVADTLPGEMEVSTLVLSTNGVKVISERAMYGDLR